RLRAADADGAHRQRPDRRRAAQPPRRSLRARRTTARGGLRLSGLRAVLARVHPPPREPERATRAAAAFAPQSTIRARAHQARAREAMEGGASAAYKRERLERLRWPAS